MRKMRCRFCGAKLGRYDKEKMCRVCEIAYHEGYRDAQSLYAKTKAFMQTHLYKDVDRRIRILERIHEHNPDYVCAKDLIRHEDEKEE